MDALWAWFNNALVQSDIISPLIGAILGTLFAGLSSPPTQTQGSAPTFNTTINNYYTYYIHHGDNGNRRSSGADDIWPYILFLFIVTAVTIWGYSSYSDVILNLWSQTLYTCLAFVVATAVISFAKGQFSSWDWVWYIAISLGMIGLCLHFIDLAQHGIIPGAREAALSYGLRGAIDFYGILSQAQKYWILGQFIGVVAGVIASVIAALRAVLYLSLMNQRGNSFLAPLWRGIARITYPLSTSMAMAGLVLMAGLSWVSLDGYLYELAMRSH